MEFGPVAYTIDLAAQDVVSNPASATGLDEAGQRVPERDIMSN